MSAEHYERAIEAIEGFCRAMRANLAAGHVARVGADARSITARCFDLAEYVALDAATKTEPGVPILGSPGAFTVAVEGGRQRAAAEGAAIRDGHDQALRYHQQGLKVRLAAKALEDVYANRHSDGTRLIAQNFEPSTALRSLINDEQVCIRNGRLNINNCAQSSGKSPEDCPMCQGTCPLGAREVLMDLPYDEELPPF